MFTSSSYSFETKKGKTIWNILDLKSGDISLWSDSADISEVVFVGDSPSSIIYLNSTNEQGDGGISLYAADASCIEDATLIASLPVPFSGLKAAKTHSGDVSFLLYSKAYPNGTAYNEQLATPPASSARIYNEIYARHWVGCPAMIVRAYFANWLP